ncbi:MAG: hypothetical protein V1822_03410 [Candidatus Micrarchaeota archaeon]
MARRRKNSENGKKFWIFGEGHLHSIMELSGKLSLAFLVLGSVQAVFVLNVILQHVFLVFEALPFYAIVCFVLSSMFFAVFSYACAAIAYLRKQYLWAVGIVLVNLLSIAYVWKYGVGKK